MIIRSVGHTAGFIAGDASFLRELLHPGKDRLAIRYSLAHAEVAPGARTRPHRLAAAEVYVILEGRGLMHVGAETAEVGAGDTVYIPPGEVQHIENAGGVRLAFLCIVDPAWTPASEEVL
jgi:mannose-6-phosphate isomerase-like protein (cupin superfamily)